MTVATPLIALVRPGPAALDWLVERVTSLKADDPLAAVTVVVPNYLAGRFVRWRLAEAGGYLNVRTLRLGELARLLAGAGGAEPVLSRVVELSAARAAVEATAPAALRDLAHHPSLQQALLRLFAELRRADVHLEASAGGGVLGQAALEIYRVYRRLTASYLDTTALTIRAAERLESAAAPAELREVGAVVLFLPPRLDPADVLLLTAMARFTPLEIALAAPGDPAGLADDAAIEMAARLALAFGLEPPTAERAISGLLEPHLKLEAVRAPDPAEETREVARRIVAALESGVPLHRQAVLYRQADPYQTLVGETLELAGLPFHSLSGQSLAESRPGRALLRLLRLPESDFSREAVLAWLDERPSSTGSSLGSASSWARLSRQAGVVRGEAEWGERLLALAAQLAERARGSETEGQETKAEDSRSQAAAALRMAEDVQTLATALAPPEATAWGDLVDWTWRLGAEQRLLEECWSTELRPAARQVWLTVESLRAGDSILTAGRPTLPDLLARLEALLASATLTVGQPGRGVIVGPLQSVSGLDLERVYLVGMVEGAFPPPPPADPFFADGSDPLDRRRQLRQRERRDFVSALRLAKDQVTLCTPDTLAGRPAFPAPWLLEVLAERLGRPALHTAAFRGLDASDVPWLTVIPSASAALRSGSPPPDLHERRLREAAAWRNGGQRLAENPLARRDGLPLAAALRLQLARDLDHFTPYDGNLASLAGTSPLLLAPLTGSPISASRIETWATCPFRYFLSALLRVESTERPEERWSIDPLERGSLIHAILEKLYRDAPTSETTESLDNRLKRLDALCDKAFAEAERRGVSGHPLVWEPAREAIRQDLHAFVRLDEQERFANALRPSYFEQAFGTGRSGSWPAVELEAGGQHVRFRGYIDRIDVDANGERARVIDYKSGSSSGYTKLAADPVLRGQHVQLALYAEAVRQAFGTGLHVDAAFWFVTSSGGHRPISPTADPPAVRSRLVEVVEQVMEGLRAGAFPQVPGSIGGDDTSNCSYCDFERVCPTNRAQLAERKRTARTVGPEYIREPA